MKIKKKRLYAGVIIAVIVLAAIFFYYDSNKQNQTAEKGAIKEEYVNPWQVDKNGFLSYPLDRGNVNFNRRDYSSDGNLSVHKIIYPSRNGNIYGLLVLPTTAADLLPGVVLLPGAGVSKESELGLAKKIALLDAAVLVIDQRGVGETTGQLNSIEQDYVDFSNGKEPTQHLMVYDALRAYDLLYSAPFVDPKRIMIAGESLGGRIAVIAAAIDRDINGVLVISSAGLDFKMTNDTRVNAFLDSINSDHYIDLISPRRLVMMHSLNDTIIPISSAAAAFSKALEPKQFILVNDTNCNHGYCDSMYDELEDALDYLVGIKSQAAVVVPVK